MTDEDALKLEPGDVVTVSIARHQVDVEVVLVDNSTIPGVMPVIYTRRLGLTHGGHRYPVVRRLPWELLHSRKRHNGDFLPHLYADWLEEHGHAEAAALLRKAFPMREV